MKVDDCNFSAPPAYENAAWPLNAPSGAKVRRVADMYSQGERYIDVTPPTTSVHVETQLGPDGSARCRLVEETLLARRILRVFCVRTFALLRRKLSKKALGVGVLAVGVGAGLAAPVLVAAHIISAVAAGILAGGSSGAAAAGGGILTLPPDRGRRDLRTEEKDAIELVDDAVQSDVRSTPGPWRPCRDTDSTHRECARV
jgi:hypothetical protein